mmetsp:Transcript_6356/g.18273  ORF Transcript_6356/g.18273 Transcript_6356/m.18273 type:complete len:428 (-) Transcript_6356:629-1912(-)
MGSSVPVFDQTIPTTSGHFAALQRVPFAADAHPFMRLEAPEDLRRLPVPEVAFARAITRHDVAPIRRKIDLASIAGIGVTLEGLLAVDAKLIQRRVCHDLVVQRLSAEPFAVGVHCDGGNGVHAWVRNVFDLHGDAQLPHTDGFVVGGGYEAASFVHEGDCVHRRQMVVVLLHSVSTVHVELIHLLVAAAAEQHVLLVVVGVQLRHVEHLPCPKRADDLAGLRIPELDARLVVAGAQELGAVVAEVYIPHTLGVAQVGAHVLAAAIDIPHFDLAIQPSRQQQMTRLREESDSIDPLGVAAPGVDPALGQVAELILRLEALGRVQPFLAGGVHLLLAVEEGGAVPRPVRVALLLLLLRLFLGHLFQVGGLLLTEHGGRHLLVSPWLPRMQLEGLVGIERWGRLLRRCSPLGLSPLHPRASKYAVALPF